MKKKIVPRKLTARQTKTMVELYQGGLSYAEIAERFGVVTRTVGAYVVEALGPQRHKRGWRSGDNRRFQ